MHIQVVTFNLQGMTDEEFRAMCDQLAPVFATIPGLISKAWLADTATNTYGGIYSWENKAALDAYMQSEIYQSVVNHPNFAGINSQDFGILEGPTRITHGMAKALA